MVVFHVFFNEANDTKSRIVDIKTERMILNDITSIRRYYVTPYGEDLEKIVFGL